MIYIYICIYYIYIYICKHKYILYNSVIMCIYIYIRTFGLCPSKVPFVLNHELVDPWAAILAFGDEVAIADLQTSMKVSRLQVKLTVYPR